MHITRFIIKDMKSGLYAGIHGFRRKYWERNINKAKLFDSLFWAQKYAGLKLINSEELKVVRATLVKCE